MKILLIIATMIFSLSCSKGPKPQTQDVKEHSAGPTAQELFIQGNQALDAKDWERAVETYDKAIELGPRWDIYVNRGIAEIQLGKFEASLHSFDEALKNGGEKESSLYLNLGNLYQERGLFENAVDAYRTGLAYVPAGQNDVDLLVNLASAYIFLSKWSEANETYTHLVKVAPNNPAGLYGLGMVLQNQRKLKDAIAMYEQVHLAFPEFAMAYYTEGQCYAHKKNWAKAVEALKNYKQLSPKSNYLKRVQALINKYQNRLKSGK